MDLRVNEMTPVTAPAAQAAREKAVEGDFSFTLKRIGNEGLAERLSGLIEDITVQGKKIADHADIRDMKRYRSLIADFINEVVTNSHEFSRENFLDRRGRHRVYGIVRLVNQNVDELAQELLQQEKDHIKILDKTGEIRGLLLDLVV